MTPVIIARTVIFHPVTLVDIYLHFERNCAFSNMSYDEYKPWNFGYAIPNIHCYRICWNKEPFRLYKHILWYATYFGFTRWIYKLKYLAISIYYTMQGWNRYAYNHESFIIDHKNLIHIWVINRFLKIF